MGTDAPESMGFKVIPGNNVYISLHPDSRAEADRLFSRLSDGGAIEMPMQDMFWGDYYGSLTDKYGIRWMVNYTSL
jgi:PhnB protein